MRIVDNLISYLVTSFLLRFDHELEVGERIILILFLFENVSSFILKFSFYLRRNRRSFYNWEEYSGEINNS